MATSTPTGIPTSTIQDRNTWVWGFTPQAEIWNGRFAMLGFVAALITEAISGEGILRFWNILQSGMPMQ